MEKKEIEKNHIRVRFNSRVGNIIRYVNALIKEENPKTIFFSAIGGAIGILVNAVEVIKIVNPGFYQLNKISSVAHKTVDNTEKTEVIERLSPKMDITLSLEKPSNTSDEGYQEKLEEEARLKLFDKLNEKGTGNRNNRGSQRGGRGARRGNNRGGNFGGNRRGNNNNYGRDRGDRPQGFGRGGMRQNSRGGQRGGQRGGPRGGPRGGMRDNGFRDNGFRDNGFRDNGFRGYRDGPRDDNRGGQRDREDFRSYRPRNDFGGNDRFNNRDGQRGYNRGGQTGGMRPPRPMQMRGRGGNFSGNRRGSMNRF